MRPASVTNSTFGRGYRYSVTLPILLHVAKLHVRETGGRRVDDNDGHCDGGLHKSSLFPAAAALCYST